MSFVVVDFDVGFNFFPPKKKGLMSFFRANGPMVKTFTAKFEYKTFNGS